MPALPPKAGIRAAPFRLSGPGLLGLAASRCCALGTKCASVMNFDRHFVQERPARFLPGVDAARDVTGRGEAGVLPPLHRHGRTLPEGAIEDDARSRG